MIMGFFSRKQKVQLEALCFDFYDRNILNPLIAGVDVGRTYADTVIRSVAEVDAAFAAVNLDRFNSEMMLIRFETFALAWIHQLGDKYAAAQSAYTNTYFKEKDRENIWEELVPYNQAIARSSTMGLTSDTPTGRARLAF